MRKQLFKTAEFRADASNTFAKMAGTTLRLTGQEHTIREANARNRAVIRELVKDRVKFADIMDECGDSPEAIWGAVKEAGGEKHSKAVRIIGMGLGDPNAYPGFPPNETVLECIRESMRVENNRSSCRYLPSYGLSPLLTYLQRVNLSDPSSVHKDPAKFSEVKVLMTAGGSEGVHYAMGSLLHRPEHTVVVHDWIYIIHLGTAYYRNATVKNYELRNDGVPDPQSLDELLHECAQNGAMVKCVVATTIGNPIGSATPREIIAEQMKVIKRRSDSSGRPIIAFFDTAYEAFRPDGKPLDPIEIAMDEGIETPVGVLETSSKGYGLCGMRLGCLRLWWPPSYYSELKHDYYQCLGFDVQPKLGHVATLIQRGLLNYFRKIERDAEVLEHDMQYFAEKRQRCSRNLLHIAEQLRGIKGVYLAKYYDHSKELDSIDPNTLASFYIAFGFDGLTNEGARHNQAAWLAQFCFDNGLPLPTCVPGSSFLPDERLSDHPALIRITGLTDADDTEAFLTSVRAAADHLKA